MQAKYTIEAPAITSGGGDKSSNFSLFDWDRLLNDDSDLDIYNSADFLDDTCFEPESLIEFLPEQLPKAFEPKIPRSPAELEAIVQAYLERHRHELEMARIATVSFSCIDCGLKMIRMGQKIVCFQCGKAEDVQVVARNPEIMRKQRCLL